MNGYRVQLATSNNRQTLMEIKARFIQKYPDTPVYLEYHAPQFKLRAGDFRTRGEADAFLVEARIHFTSAFIVPDKIIVEGVKW